MKKTLLFVYGTNFLVHLLTVNMKNCLTPKNPKMCDPILVTLLKMRSHYSHSSRENATPSSGTSPIASYEEVPAPGISPTLNARFIQLINCGPVRTVALSAQSALTNLSPLEDMLFLCLSRFLRW